MKNLRFFFFSCLCEEAVEGFKAGKKLDRVCILKEVWSLCGEWTAKSEWDPTGGHDGCWIEDVEVLDASHDVLAL